jgi:outer membrane protein assembly factor BamD
MVRNSLRYTAVLLALAVLLSSCGLRRKKYDNRITKDTQQPDKVLFDTAIDDIEHSRFERARLTLQTLMNTYDTSEYMAKAKLAVADSWYREGGSHGMAQAEAEYKDFILFYPNMEEAAEAQSKICQMQFKQVEKADRDNLHAIRAEEECRQLLTQFPNSKFAPEAQKIVLQVQEVRADGEYRVGTFYRHKGSFFSAANRLQGLTDQFPLYSNADGALWELADSYHRLGDKFEKQEAAQYTRIVKDYPLSEHVEEAKARLQQMNQPVPESDPVQYARMKYELENREKRGLMSKAWGPFSSRPDLTAAAKSGSPQMSSFKPTIPASVPAPAAGAQGVSATLTADVVTDPTAIDKQPDARANPPAAGGTATAAGAAPAQPAQPAAAPNAVTRTGVDINTASEQELEKLPGIGKTIAKRIVQTRPFLSVDDLRRIGISQKTIDKLKPVKTNSSGAAATKP